jgi:hypothetical protein
MSDRVDRLVTRMLRMDWDNFPQGSCHGDLTLENILLRQDNSLSFIDFDVPEHCSWHLDIGKLYQDVWGYWCLRTLALADPGGADLVNAQVRLHQLSAVFAGQIELLVPDGRARIRQMAAFHLMQTLPYTSHGEVARYAVGRIEAVLDVV